ncbi:MAG: hypothetical protein K2N47_03200, partial [Clostridia bacterium]|nr:hypothetical protein [Clostridia bacterium]
MAANKKTKQQFETFDLDGELLNCVSYATYYNRVPLFTSIRLINNGEQAFEELVVNITGGNKLI